MSAWNLRRNHHNEIENILHVMRQPATHELTMLGDSIVILRSTSVICLKRSTSKFFRHIETANCAIMLGIETHLRGNIIDMCRMGWLAESFRLAHNDIYNAISGNCKSAEILWCG